MVGAELGAAPCSRCLLVLTHSWKTSASTSQPRPAAAGRGTVSGGALLFYEKTQSVPKAYPSRIDAAKRIEHICASDMKHSVCAERDRMRFLTRSVVFKKEPTPPMVASVVLKVYRASQNAEQRRTLMGGEVAISSYSSIYRQVCTAAPPGHQIAHFDMQRALLGAMGCRLAFGAEVPLEN